MDIIANIKCIPELIVALACVIVFIGFVIWGQRQSWIALTSGLLTVCGAAFAFIPDKILGYMTTGALKLVDVELARLYGATLIGTCFLWFWTRETRDATVPITILMSHVFSSSMLLVAQGFTFYADKTKRRSSDSPDVTPVDWIDEYPLTLMLPTLLWLLGNLYHLCRSHDFSTYPQHNTRLNNNLRLDALIQLLIGAIFITYPTQLVGSVVSGGEGDKVGLHIARSTGILCIGEAIVSLQAPGYLHVRDKRAVFIARLASLSMQLAALGVSVCMGVLLQRCLLQLLLLVAPLLINALIGLFTDGTVIYRVPSAAPSPNKNRHQE